MRDYAWAVAAFALLGTWRAVYERRYDDVWGHLLGLVIGLMLVYINRPDKPKPPRDERPGQ